MRVLGIDPSSTYGGVATIDTPDTVLDVAHWKRGTRDTHPQGLLSWYFWLRTYIAMWQPHMAAIEMHAYSGGKENSAATHKVAYYQGVACLACKVSNLLVIEVRVSTARSIVLGNGGLSKEKAWEEMRSRFPSIFSAKLQGGLDECDALTAALAGEVAAER